MATLRRLGPAALGLALVLGGCGTVVDWPAAVPEATVPAGAGTPTVPDAPVAVDGGRRTASDPAGESESGSGTEAFDDDDLVDLAARMDDVLRSGDEDSWAALFDGDDLVEQQRDWFRGVREVPMDVRQILPGTVLDVDTVEDVDTPQDAVVRLAFVHQVSGADPVPAVESYRMTVRRSQGEEPRITEVRGEDGDDGHPQLWDLSAVAVTVTDSLVLIAPQGREGDVAAVLPGLQSATANVFLDFDEGPRERLVVQLTDAADLRAIADDQDLAVDPAGIAMMTAGLGERPAPGETGVSRSRDEHVDRIVLDLDRLLDDLAFGVPPGGWGLMRHEGVHAVVDGDPGVNPPVWVWEGLAEWYGFRRDYDVAAAYRQVVASADGEPLELPDSFDDYYYDSQEAGQIAYASSAMVFSFLEQRFGFETARDVGVGLTGVDGWRDTTEADVLLLDLTGMTLEGLEQQWAQWAVATYG